MMRAIDKLSVTKTCKETDRFAKRNREKFWKRWSEKE